MSRPLLEYRRLLLNNRKYRPTPRQSQSVAENHQDEAIGITRAPKAKRVFYLL
jgi:hypothetical protein